MKRILLCMFTVLACGSMALAQSAKDNQMKYIRKCYAEAKEKMAQNGRNGQSPKDLRLILNRLEDEDIPLYDMEQLDYFFEQTIDENGGVKTLPPYLVVEKWSNHGHERYREVLLDPKGHKVIFCYMRGETDAGFVVESRYYYNAQGQCIEEKHNTPNSWTSKESEKETAENYLKIFGMFTYNGYFSPLDTDASKKSTTPKAERLSHIRSVYAQAQAKAAQNDKAEMPNNLHITLHDLGDDQPPRTIDTKIYFDNDGIYFINSHSASMQSDGYSEYLFEPKGKNLIFSYTRGAEEGEVYEWRYYYDENGKCIETKSNSEEVDEGFYDKRAAKDYQAIYQELCDKLGS